MKKFISTVLSLLILLSLCSCSADNSVQKKEMFKKDFIDLFDTASSITAADESQQSFNEHFEAVYDELEEYSRLFDIYNSYGDLVNLKYINENAGASPVKADEKILDLLEYAVKAYDITQGRVNIMLGAVLSVWHAERENGIASPESARLPDKSVLQEKVKSADISNLVIDRENGTVFFKDPDMRLDVGAIAKGYVCEKISEFIVENNIWSSALINLGGNIKTVGYKYDDEKTEFSVGIESPSGSDYVCIINASCGKTAATAGDYQRYYTVDGKKYCHIIDPETLMPAEYVSAVSVVCNDSALADSLSTALFNMSVENGKALVESLGGVEAVWTDKNGKVYYSSGFEDLIR